MTEADVRSAGRRATCDRSACSSAPTARSPSSGAPTRCWASRPRVAVTEPADHPPADRPVPGAVPAGGRRRGRARLRRGGGLGLLRARPRRVGVRRFRAAAPAAARLRRVGALRRVPRVRARRRGPLQRRAARRHGRGAVPGLAGVLHRRHRQLPAGPGRPDPHRPGRPLLQRDRRRPHLRVVVGDGMGSPAAAGRHPGPADGAAAAAPAALRRLPPAGRPRRVSPTSTSGSGRPCSGSCRTAGRHRRTGCSPRGRAR